MKRDTHACGTQHRCDFPEVRDEHLIGPATEDLVVRLNWVVFGTEDRDFAVDIAKQVRIENSL
jgi:hypothetical protein